MNIPQYYVIKTLIKAWIRRQKNQQFNANDRMSIVNHKDSERFYLKSILHKMKKVTCFKDLLTVEKIFYKTLIIKKQLWL